MITLRAIFLAITSFIATIFLAFFQGSNIGRRNLEQQQQEEQNERRNKIKKIDTYVDNLNNAQTIDKLREFERKD